MTDNEIADLLRKKTAEAKERRREQNREYKARNREHIRQKDAIYREQNREKLRDGYRARWAGATDEQKQKHAEANKRHRVRKAGTA